VKQEIALGSVAGLETQFLSIAIGSLAELETQYLIAIRLGFLEKDKSLTNLINDEKQLLLGFRNYIKKKT
jgi:four helix bundle protein